MALGAEMVLPVVSVKYVQMYLANLEETIPEPKA